VSPRFKALILLSSRSMGGCVRTKRRTRLLQQTEKLRFPSAEQQIVGRLALHCGEEEACQSA
jgi:hypothetical protein